MVSAILSAAIALMHANLRPGQTPRGIFKGQSTNYANYPGSQYTWKQLHDSLKSAGLLDVLLLDLPADQTDNHIPRSHAEYRAARAKYKAEYNARPEVMAARAEYYSLQREMQNMERARRELPPLGTLEQGEPATDEEIEVEELESKV